MRLLYCETEGIIKFTKYRLLFFEKKNIKITTKSFSKVLDFLSTKSFLLREVILLKYPYTGEGLKKSRGALVPLPFYRSSHAYIAD